ncbi:MAG: GGDEF domain-containing protein, partial [Clostridiales bacterium]|nr:GGDEF domain-containing protein [Clostridiales bacterium]
KYTIILGAVDHFKQVNEDHGHLVGDMVLRNIAQILHRNVVGRGFAARWGGAEFLIVYMDMDRKEASEELEAVLNQIRQSSVTFNDQIIRVTMTFGVAEGDFRKELRELFKEADSNMLYGKRQGRNQIVSGLSE